ncbi:hypothetical protein CDL12_05826 [Handroanthus impetiginosus]|uniref:Thaumatin n=1 Tax=Handroanthus impetiginosus TaxID=429701 RepID=A0A2G9HVX3_9LAMI|nr:hypothetical protein CDL12_05826 [Handroanthus impetiginosus]
MATKILPSFILALLFLYGGHSVTFTVQNNCGFTIWPATQTSKGAPITTGFQLESKTQTTLTVPSPWSGRIWARYLCSNSGRFTCLSGDCNSGQVQCNGAGAIPPASLFEITLAGDAGRDFYDISLVDGFNLPILGRPHGTGCVSTSCPADIDRGCPNELAVRGPSGAVIGCRSACDVFKEARYCCTGDYSSPATCTPTNYSQVFKRQCPQAYSYAFDDQSSTFTCPTGGNFVVTFCP